MIGATAFPPLAEDWRGCDEMLNFRSHVMSKTKSTRIQDHFTEFTDPRRREGTYPLTNIVVIAICAVICGADDFVAIAKFGRTKRDWLARFLDLSSGIPHSAVRSHRLDRLRVRIERLFRVSRSWPHPTKRVRMGRRQNRLGSSWTLRRRPRIGG